MQSCSWLASAPMASQSGACERQWQPPSPFPCCLQMQTSGAPFGRAPAMTTEEAEAHATAAVEAKQAETLARLEQGLPSQRTKRVDRNNFKCSKCLKVGGDASWSFRPPLHAQRSWSTDTWNDGAVTPSSRQAANLRFPSICDEQAVTFSCTMASLLCLYYNLAVPLRLQALRLVC